MGSVTRELALAAIPDQPEQYSDIGKQHRQDLMVDGFGALPVVPPKYEPANDNVEGGKRYHSGGFVGGPTGEVPPIVKRDYVLPRALHEALMTRGHDRGPFIQIYPARKFYPFDPKPEEVFIESIAHGLANICRYSGAGERHFSVAEHSTLIARYLAARYAPEVALAGLLHDAPESLSGFGDVGRPVKGRAPIISETEDGIYRLAVAPRFGLPLDIPAEVHEADNRIIADEIAANLAPMEWQSKYDRPLGVNIRCWSPEKAEIEFLATFDALTGRKRGMEA
ncbi:hypothetical protein J0664_06210 [Rhizobium leguminosarum]|uniref:hypothetical protein n=1 Tax=Rhizobium leguminosarum TaxID=384 RepID=UPI001A91E394|nr:hypothetical protein [Rhizobium leguminosarum]MBY5553696.1 hypothetical protein [Rhizobium leguminosarum]QSW24889.1 hypothetical protein J0664_06210 [Rhizobium leguminosarum]